MHIIEQAGRALYGEEWLAKLAHELDVSSRALRRMSTEQQPVPSGVYVELMTSVLNRNSDLLEIIPPLADLVKIALDADVE
jgi:Zn-dependent peptidase ImmA (M78 family)